MGKQKLRKYAAAEEFPNVLYTYIEDDKLVRFSRPFDLKAFAGERQLTLELGCGKGDYSVELARKYPDRRFIGIDIKGDRLWQGAKTALDENLTNVFFIRTGIEKLCEFFNAKSISEVWIPFPDPYPTKKGLKRRLTSIRFLGIYKNILKERGLVHFKTDDTDLYTFTREIVMDNSLTLLASTADLYGSGIMSYDVKSIQTTYEKRYLANGKKIKYLSFSFPVES